jgi:CRP/FNR family transcriptional regulator, cyclic AMP receptor protein
MSKKSKVTFDPKTFLAIVGDGKTIAKYQKDQIVFSQGGRRGRGFLHPERPA